MEWAGRGLQVEADGQEQVRCHVLLPGTLQFGNDVVRIPRCRKLADRGTALLQLPVQRSRDVIVSKDQGMTRPLGTGDFGFW